MSPFIKCSGFNAAYYHLMLYALQHRAACSGQPWVRWHMSYTLLFIRPDVSTKSNVAHHSNAK